MAQDRRRHPRHPRRIYPTNPRLGTLGESLSCPVIVVANERNSGHGASSVRAWHLGLESGATTIVHVDGDGQYSGYDIVRIAQAASGYDGAMGIRTVRADPWFRRVVTTALRSYVGVMTVSRVRDANTPLRAYRAEELSRLLNMLPDAPLVPSVYLSAAGVSRGLNIVEIEVESRDRRGETATGSMWGESALAFLPTMRLVRFVARAGFESVATLWALRRHASHG